MAIESTITKRRKTKVRTCEVCGLTSENASVFNTKYDNKAYTLCSRHYQLLRGYGKFKTIVEEKKERVCDSCGISAGETEILKTVLDGKEINLCRREYATVAKHGRFKLTKENEYVELENCYKLKVYSRDGQTGYETFFSKQHYNEVKKYSWYLYKPHPKSGVTNYIYGSKGVKLHRVIGELLFGKLDGNSIDHIDRNGLNNVDENLRLADDYIQMANQGISKRNTSGVRGVSFSKAANKWRARIRYKTISKEVICDSFDEAVALRLKWENERDEYLGI